MRRCQCREGKRRGREGSCAESSWPSSRQLLYAQAVVRTGRLSKQNRQQVRDHIPGRSERVGRWWVPVVGPPRMKAGFRWAYTTIDRIELCSARFGQSPTGCSEHINASAVLATWVLELSQRVKSNLANERNTLTWHLWDLHTLGRIGKVVSSLEVVGVGAMGLQSQ